jgi:hypothetical protein
MKTKLFKLLPVLLALSALAGLGHTVRHMTRVAAEVKAVALTEAQLQTVIDAQRLVMAAGILPTPGERDAGPLLNHQLRVDGGSEPALSPPWWAENEAANALRCKGAPKDERSTYLRCIDTLPDGDLTLTQALLEYDTWSLTASGPLAALPDRQATEDTQGRYLTLNLIPIQHLAKLRIAQGMRRGDILAALAEVRHLANLSFTTDDFIGLLIGSALLGIENSGAQEALRRGLIEPGAWTPRTEEERKALRFAIEGSLAMSLGRAPEGALARLLAEVPNPVGLCATFSEGAAQLRAHRWMGAHRWPGEPDLGPLVRYLDEVSASGRCDDARLMASWRAQERDLQHVALLPTGSNGQPWWDDAWRQDEARMAREKALARLPYLRVYRLGEALLSPIQMSRFPESS